MRQIYLILISLISLIAIGFNNTSNKTDEKTNKDTLISNHQISLKDSVVKDDKDEDKIYNLILAIPEVKERGNYIEKETKGKRHIQLMIVETPKDNKSNYYCVKVGEDNGTNFVTHFNFYVYPEKPEIKYYDIINDTAISLDAWRKNNKDL